jgi:hypothetical protein
LNFFQSLKPLKLLWGFFKLLSAIVAFLSIAILVILIWPQILVNEKTLELAAQFAARKGIQVHWDSVDIQLDSISLLQKRADFNFSQLCIDVPQEEISGCSSGVRIAFGGGFSHWVPRLTEVGPLEIQNLKWQFKKGKDGLQGELTLKGKEREEGRELQGVGRWIFDLSGSARFPDHSQLSLRSSLHLEGERIKRLKLNYFADARYSSGKATAGAHLEGSVSENEITTRISGVGRNWLDEVSRIGVSACNLSLNREKVNQLRVDCPVSLRVNAIPQSIHGIRVPNDFAVTVQAQVKTSTFLPGADTRVEGPVSLTLDPIVNPLVMARGQVNANVNGLLSEFPDRWSMETQLQLSLNILRFEDLVRQLRNGPWAIPAPFHVLRGNAEVKVEGSTALAEGRFPFTVKTRLASSEQTVDLDGEGLFTYPFPWGKQKPDLQLNLVLSDVQLTLPRLDWAAPPRILPDSRIRALTGRSSDSESSSLEYRISIKTPAGHPVRILSNLTQSPIPVSTSLSLSDSEPFLGWVRVEGFPIEFFRRKADIQQFTLNIQSPIKESSIQGAVRVAYADYTIFLKAAGTVDKPILHLTSDPPLPENQLFATLLFGQPLDQLNAEQSDSIGNTRTAFAEGAVGLASLYVLASTPIQSVNYDPQTRTVSAKIRLGDGTSLNVGSETGSPTVGLRKRLGPFWTLETDVTTNNTNASDSRGIGGVASAYLQWSHRY